MALILTLLALAAVMLRVYARRIKAVKLGWDDYLISLALVRAHAYPCRWDHKGPYIDFGVSFSPLLLEFAW